MQSGDSKIGFDELSKLKLVKQAVSKIDGWLSCLTLNGRYKKLFDYDPHRWLCARLKIQWKQDHTL